jgi:hypothetical protein
MHSIVEEQGVNPIMCWRRGTGKGQNDEYVQWLAAVLVLVPVHDRSTAVEVHSHHDATMNLSLQAPQRWSVQPRPSDCVT